MENFLEPIRVGLFLAIAVPGIVILYFRSRFLSGKMPRGHDGVLSYVTISLVYHAVGFLIFGLPSEDFQQARLPLRLFLITYVFLIPMIVGSVSGLSVKKGWLDLRLSKIGLNVVHPVDSAWDWYFANCQQCWAIFKLKDGTRWAGVLGLNSFISSDPLERDVYIEKVYLIGDNDEWLESDSAVWLAHNEIQSIEMWKKT